MFDESTGISSAVNFEKLRQECFSISGNFHINIEDFPNIKTLAGEFISTATKIEDIVKAIGRNDKIKAIKAVRERFPGLGLTDAKILVDEHFVRLGWVTKY